MTGSLSLLLAVGALACAAPSDRGRITKVAGALKLWYRQPARQWIEALPLGNGRLGAMVFGDPVKERIQLNENTLWDWPPAEPDEPGRAQIPAAGPPPALRGQKRRGHAARRQVLMGRPERIKSCQSLGDLWLDLDHSGEVRDYRRDAATGT